MARRSNVNPNLRDPAADAYYNSIVQPPEFRGYPTPPYVDKPEIDKPEIASREKPKTNKRPDKPESFARGGTVGYGVNYTPIKTDPVARRRYSLKHTGYAEGGEVDPDQPAPQAAPDIASYVQGANAMPPEELDAALQQIAQLDPNQSEDVVNLTAITQAVQSGDMERASSILAGFRKRFDSLNAHAQGAAAHGDMVAAAQLASKAHSQVPDGLTVAYAVAPDGSGVTATVSPNGQTFQMSSQQFHDYLVGPGTSFDHILENGLEQNLAIATGRQGGQQAPPEAPPQAPPEDQAPVGYAEGGPVERQPRNYAYGGSVEDNTYSSYGDSGGSSYNSSYTDSGQDYVDSGQDGSGQDYLRQQEEEQERQREEQQQLAREVLKYTRDSYGLSDDRGGPSRDDISSETADLGLGRDRVEPLTGDETQLAYNEQKARAGRMFIGAYGSEPGGGVNFASDVYMGPGGGGGGGGGRRRSSGGGGGGGGGRRSGGGGDRSGGDSRAVKDTGNTDAQFWDMPQDYTTGYKQDIEYTPQKPGDDLRRVDTAGNPIGPEIGQPVPAAAAAGEPVRTDTQGRPIGGVDTRPDPNDPREYARREFPDNPAGQNAVIANQYLRGSQREFDALQAAHERGGLTPDTAARLESLKKGRQEAAYDWDAFAKENKLKSAQQVIEEAQQLSQGRGGGGKRSEGGGGGAAHPRYGHDVRDPDGWPTGVPRGGSFANVPWSTNRDFAEPVSFGRRGQVGRPGSQAEYNVWADGQIKGYDVNTRAGTPRAQQFQPGYQGPRQGERGWTGIPDAPRPAAPPPTYQTRPVAPQSRAPAGGGANATVGDLAPRVVPGGDPNDPENAAPYKVAGKDWIPPPAQAAPAAGAAPPAAGAAPPATDERGGPPGAVYADQPKWRPAPNSRGFTAIPPPDSDKSPEAQAARDFPGASVQDKRRDRAIQLRQEERADALRRETLATKDTPADRMARATLAANTKRLNNMDTNAQRQYATDMHKIIADDKLFESARQLAVREMGDAVGELAKNYRNGVAMMGSKYVPTDDEKAAMLVLHDQVEKFKRGVGGAPQVSQPPAAPGGATVDTPATRTAPAPAAAPAATPAPTTGGGMPDLRTYTGAQPPWAAPQGQKWQQHPITKLYRLVPQ